MKTLVKSFFMTLAAVAASSAIAADMTTKVVSFSTQPGLVYGDGSAVLNGEYVALCWSPNENFGGIIVKDGKFVEKEACDDVICALPKVMYGRVSPQVFLFNDRGPGNYFVFVLDTRISATELASSPSVLNGASKAFGVASNAEVLSGSGAAPSTDYSAETYVTTKPTLDIGMVDGVPTITAVGLSPILKYKIVCGDEPGSLDSTLVPELTYFVDGDGVAFTFEDPAQAKFFQLVPVK